MPKELKSLTASELQSWLVPQNKITNVETAYKAVSLMYRCLNLRANSLISIPRHFEDLNGEIVDDPDIGYFTPIASTDLNNIIWLIEASMLLEGFSAVVVLRNIEASPLGLMFLNPGFTTVNQLVETGMQINRGIFRHSSKIQFAYSSDVLTGNWDDEDTIYFRDWNPSSDIDPGNGAAGVSFAESQLDFYLKRFATRFFESGAMPVTLLEMEKNVKQSEIKRVEFFFKRLASGIGNAWNTIGIHSSINVQSFTPDIKDMDLTGLNRGTEVGITDAFNVPITLVREGSNRAETETKRQSFFAETVVPRANMIANMANVQFFNDLGLKLVFDHTQMDLFQFDEALRSSSVVELVSVGTPLLTAMDILGYDLTMDQRKEIESAETQKQDRAAAVVSNFTQPNVDAEKSELKKWERVILARLKRGDKSLYDFRAVSLSPEYVIWIKSYLERSLSVPQIKALLRGTKQAFDEAAQYQADIRAAINDFEQGVLNEDELESRLEAVIIAGLTAIFLSSVQKQETDQLSADEAEHLQGVIAVSLAALPDLVADVTEDRFSPTALTEDDKPRLDLGARLARWGATGIGLFNAGRSFVQKNSNQVWILGPTIKHCSDCLRLDGQIHTGAEWLASPFFPQSRKLKCRGFGLCLLLPTGQDQSGGF